jgi:hypothetical protein
MDLAARLGKAIIGASSQALERIKRERYRDHDFCRGFDQVAEVNRRAELAIHEALAAVRWVDR